MASKTVTRLTRSIKYKQKPMSFWYKCYVLLKQNPFPSMHLACSSLVHLTAIFLCVLMLCSRPPGEVFLLLFLEKSLKGWEWGVGKVSVKANETGQHVETTSTIFRTACQSMVEQDAATQQTILRGHSLSLCKERYYYKPVRVWMVRIQKPWKRERDCLG